MDCQQLFSVIDALSEEYIGVWEDVCNLESPTADKARVDKVGAYFADMARSRGWKVESLKLETAGDPICITMNPEANARPVTFSGHIDTVHPVGLFGDPPAHRDGEKLYGPGALDCKGGVVASFMAMDALARCGFAARPVQLIIQTDEETGSRTSGKRTVEYMCRMAKDSVAFLNTEGADGNKVVVARKGILRYQFHIQGKATHSARCEEGANAITEAAHKILKLEEMKDPKGLTCNCGVIRGGTVANTVAEECSFFADIRFADQSQYEQAAATVQAVAEQSHVPGCTCRVEKISDRPAMPLEDRNLELLEKINSIYAQVGLEQLVGKRERGGSDTAYTTMAGIPCLDSFGVEGNGIHSIREYGLLSSLALSAKRQAAVAFCI